MRQSALLEFESSAFAIEASEDAHTNPGVCGKRLAEWLSQQLRGRGLGIGEVVAEDFGWCIPVESKPHRLYVACSNAEEEPNHWRVFAFAEGGLVARLFGKAQSSQSLALLFATLKEVLQSTPHVKVLREEAA